MQEIHKSLTQKSKSYKKWHKFSGHETYHWLILIVLVVFAGMVIDKKAEFLFGEAAHQDNGAQFGNALEQQIPELSKQMLDLAHKLRKAAPEEREAVLAELMAVAEERKALVGQAIQENPRVAVNSALNNQLRAQMPQEVRDMIEEKKTIRGTFEYAIGEDPENHVLENEFSVVERGTGTRFKINFPENEHPLAETDDEVSIAGVVSDDNVAAVTEDVTVTAEAGVVASEQKKMAVIIFNFTNLTGTPISIDSARTKYFTGARSINAIYKENSFGTMDIVGHLRPDGDVFGVYTINDTDAGCDKYTWASKADQLAQQHGYVKTNYDFISYIFPSTFECGIDTNKDGVNDKRYIGWATLGGSPAQSWMNGNPPDWALVHEMGHNFGAYHAWAWTCDANKSSISSSCVVKNLDDQYGDDANTMGNHSVWHHSNYNKGRSQYHFGWLSAANTHTVDKNAQPDNVYTIAPIEISSGGIQSLRILKTAATTKTPAEYYYLEFRQPIGFDNGLLSSQQVNTTYAYNGVYVRLARDYNSGAETKLLDMNPLGDGKFQDAALQVGKSFVDSSLGMTVTLQSVATEGAKVRVTFGNVTTTCTRANPVVTISPSSATTEAGGTLKYTVKVTNRDSAACAQSTFSVAPTNMPSGFLQSPTSFSSGPLSPGATYSQVINVTSADTVADGTYTFNQRAQNTTATSYVASASANYIVAFVDSQNPQVSLTAPTNASTVTGTVAVSATASDNIGVTDVVFKVDGTTIGQDASSPYSVQWDSSSVSNGAHNVVAVARDAAGNTANSAVSVTTSNTVTGDTIVPQASIQSPANGSNLSNGQNNISVSASDNVRVASIDILLDGNIIGTCTGSQKTLSCTARFLGNKEASGSHFILVRAKDAAGNIGTAQINVTK